MDWSKMTQITPEVNHFVDINELLQLMYKLKDK